MANPNGTPKAVVLAAVLHLGIVAFLFLAILPCADYEGFITKLGLPASWNPITCERPLELPGQIINATLIGPTGSPPPKSAKVKPVKDATPPPPTPPVPPPPTPPPPDKTPDRELPPPPKQPDIKDQEKVVADALIKAEDAKKEQEEKQKQQQAELDAEAAKLKKQKIDEAFKALDAAQANVSKADASKKVAQKQMEDMKNAKADALPDLPASDQLQSGNNGADSGLRGKYMAAIQNAVTQNWIRPDTVQNGQVCKVHVKQLPGGDVLSVNVDPSCPYDAAGRTSVENAVLAAKPLPYQGFETVFQRDLTITFNPK